MSRRPQLMWPNPSRRGRPRRRSAAGHGVVRAVRFAPGLVALCLPLLHGCYVYQPVSLAELAPGEEVRVRVTTEAIARADSVMAVDREMEGTFAGLEEDDFLLDVAIETGQSGFRQEGLSQRLDLRTQDLLDVERRSIDQVRTGAVLGAVGAVAAIAALSAFSKSGGNTSTTPPTPGDGVVLQLFRLVLPWSR